MFNVFHYKALIFEEAVRARARACVRSCVRACVRARARSCVRSCARVRVRAGACAGVHAYVCLKLRLPGFSNRPWCAHLCGSVQA